MKISVQTEYITRMSSVVKTQTKYLIAMCPLGDSMFSYLIRQITYWKDVLILDYFLQIQMNLFYIDRQLYVSILWCNNIIHYQYILHYVIGLSYYYPVQIDKTNEIIIFIALERIRRFNFTKSNSCHPTN